MGGVRMGMGRWRGWVIAGFAGCLGAVAGGCCPGVRFTIEMEVDEDGFNRSVAVTSSQKTSRARDGGDGEDGGKTAERAASSLPEGLRASFVAVYGVGEPIEQGERFAGTFVDATPQDVGGPGTLLRVKSELGTAFHYHERFGGSFPTLQARKLREQAVDGLFDWLTDWLRQDLTADEQATRILAAIDGPIRADAQDFVCLFEGLATVPDDGERGNGDPTGMLQFGHFLVERGYLTPRKLALLAISRPTEDEQKRLVIKALRTRLSVAADVPSDAAAMNRLFGDLEDTQARLDDYLRTRPEFQRLVEREATSENPGEVDPNDLIGEQLAPLLASYLAHALACRQNLDVTWKTGARPFTTNGEWDEATQAVRWSDRRITGKQDEPASERGRKQGSERGGEAAEGEPLIDAAATGLPVILATGWSIPDEAQQMDWFGKILFEAEQLANYCAWRQRLSDDAAAGWRTCVEELRQLPPSARNARLREFLTTLPDPLSEEALLQTLATSLLSVR